MNRNLIDRRMFVQASTAILTGLSLPGRSQSAPLDTERHVLPKSRPPARALHAFRLQELTSLSGDFRLTLNSLQGIVNRSQPRLYLAQDRYDELWLDWLRERGDVDSVQWLEIGQVFERFLPEVTTGFVIDPEIPASVNVASMLASLHNGLVVTPRIAEQFKLPLGVIPQDSGLQGRDLRYMHWKTDLDAYRWFFQRFGDRMSRQAVALLSPREAALRDYLIEFKIPILWISGTADTATNPKASPEEELEFAREILMKWPPNIPCLGWPQENDPKPGGLGEVPGLQLLSECAKFMVCSGYDGHSPGCSNLSVHSGTSAQFRQPIPPVTLQRDKVYVSFIRTDGDGPNFQRHYYRKLFDEPSHGAVPVGWQIGPLAFDCQPDILDYYYKKSRAGDCFVNALSGLCYMIEDNYAENFSAEQRERIWRSYMELSDLYRRRLDFTTLCTYAEMRPERLERFAQLPGIKGIFANYWRSPETTPDNTVTEVKGVPVFRCINEVLSGGAEQIYTPWSREQRVITTINEIRRWSPSQRPGFLNVTLANWLTEMKMAENIAKGLGPDYVVVRPDQLADLYGQYRAG